MKKEAWEELKQYLNESWLPEDEQIRKNLLAKMKQLEKRWKIVPDNPELLKGA